ncbi:MAG: hypothetical protein E7353_09760 [Clostridiales bacterium]|nr:hypothetical protein [Clostridiales bacterium]
MAKKNGSPFSVVCAFWGLLIASAVFVASGIFQAFGILTSVVSILDLIGKVALFLAVAIIAFQFTRGKKAGWKIVYWVALIVYATGVVFGIVRF